LIDPDDLIILGNPSIHNRLAVDAPGGLDGATVEAIALRLSQLESKPVVGAYDAIHLQQIHARIFQDLFPWAGQLRSPESSSSLETLFDRLARENRLKGCDGDAWSQRSIEYFREITAIEPFIDGNEFASLEFFRQLANENNMTLRCVDCMIAPFRDELTSQLQRTQGNNVRRILMLAVDPYPTAMRPSRVLEAPNPLELITDPNGFS
jgi:cell filamentation protein